MSSRSDADGKEAFDQDVPSSRLPVRMSRRAFVETAAIAGASLATLSMSGETPVAQSRGHNTGDSAMNRENSMADEIAKEKIRRALLAGPDCVTKEATVAEMDAHGKLTVLRQGTNQWVCIPGNENIVGAADMCLDPMGMVFWLDLLAKKPKPTNTSPGLDLHAQWGYSAELYRSVRQDQSGHTDRSTLDDPLAVRCEARRIIDGHARRRNNGDVRWHAVRPFARLRFTVGWE